MIYDNTKSGNREYPVVRFIGPIIRAVVFGVVFAIAVLSRADANPPDIDVAAWKSQTLEQLMQSLTEVAAESAEAEEITARIEWLRAWTPAPSLEFDAVTTPQQRSPWLVPEPNLSRKIERSNGRWKEDAMLASLLSIAALQNELQLLDAPQTRKQNVVQTAEKCAELIAALQQWQKDHADFRSRGFVTSDDLFWLELHTRYRMGRAKGYRELPEVLDQIPIEDVPAYDQDLRDTYRELLAVSQRQRPEFVLLDVRMLRRDEQLGRSLQMLDAYRWAIADRWYLKKRRDILRKLGWGPPAEQASLAYAALLQELGISEDSPAQ